jgi:hypothetical protein
MIFYPTKETIEKYHIPLTKDLKEPFDVLGKNVLAKEKDDRLLEWGMKMFYFDRRKCIQIENFQTKFTLFLVDVPVKQMPKIGDLISIYFDDLYQDDPQMIQALENMSTEHSLITFEKLTDRSSISSMNRCQSDFTLDGYRFYDFIVDGVLQTKKINRQVNFVWLVSDQKYLKNKYYCTGKRFRDEMVNRFVSHK